jgi:subfamily B ATP-binding cassette protein MsbA
VRKGEALRRLWPYIKPHTGSVAMAMLLSIPMAAIAFIGAPAVKFLTDEVLAKKSYDNLRWLVFMIIGGAVLNFVVRFLNNYLIRAAASRMTQSIRNDLYSHILKLSAGYFSEAQGGALVSRVLNDVQLISRAISSLIDLVKEPITFLALLGYAFYLNWSLTLITLVMIPACALLLSNTGRHSKRYSGRINDKLGEMSSLLMESISGMRVIQAFRLERYLRGQFMKVNRDFTRTALKAIRSEELSRPAVDLLFFMAIAFLFFYAGREALKDRMSPGDVVAFFLAFGLIINPLKKLSELTISLNQSAAAVDTIFKIMAIQPEVRDNPGAPVLAPFAREIEFRNVTFRYQKNGTRQLKDFSLKVKKGEVVALVGASGAGKSTLLSLIPRFYDPEAGAVLVDGQDIRGVQLESLRAQISLVTQEVFLFHDTVRANIRAGRHEVTDERLQEAARAAQAWQFIERMPNGVNSVIGDRGQKLSGGERQRLSIARAILKDAPILLLDEATSALDSENERLVQAALDRLLVGRTAIVVAHRLSTVRKADRILVMEKGMILEEGSHEELLARGGAYARALSHQEGFPL